MRALHPAVAFVSDSSRRLIEPCLLYTSRGEKYKVEHIGDLDDDARIPFYQQGDYIAMCVGPHICYLSLIHI